MNMEDSSQNTESIDQKPFPTEAERRDNFLKEELICFAERVLNANEQTWWYEAAVIDVLSDNLKETKVRLRRLMNELIREGRISRKIQRELPKKATRGEHRHSATRGVAREIDRSRASRRSYIRTNEPRTIMASDYNYWEGMDRLP